MSASGAFARRAGLGLLACCRSYSEDPSDKLTEDMSLTRFRCPHCGQNGVPRWLGAFSSGYFPARCDCCLGKSKVTWLVQLWQALLATSAPVAIVVVLALAHRAPAAAYALAGIGLILFATPPWFVPLRPASSHGGESILQSIHRHCRRHAK